MDAKKLLKIIPTNLNPDDYWILMYHKDKYAIVPISWQVIDDDNDKLYATVLKNLFKSVNKEQS